MKNYVVWTNCEIRNKDADSRHGLAPAVTKDYDLMFDISLASARKYIGGTWEPMVFSDPAESRVAMFQANWQRIWDLWHLEPCNILYLDSDTVTVRATDIFGRFEEFRLFNWTCPKSSQKFPNYFNAGVRYYPATIKPEVWQRGQQAAENWNLNIWDQEQIIFNDMFWSQDLSWEDAHRPELNWQWPASDGPHHDAYNTIPMPQAHIIHYHGTRGSDQAAKKARTLAAAAGVEYEKH